MTEPMDYRIQNEQLVINGKAIAFQYPVVERETLQVQDLLLILLDTYNAPRLSEEAVQNIFALNAEGECVWQVAAPFSPVTGEALPNGFTGMRLTAEGEVRAAVWNGPYFQINLADGSLTPLNITPY
jgi:hypothetical protein